jgi:hypothetical protein
VVTCPPPSHHHLHPFFLRFSCTPRYATAGGITNTALNLIRSSDTGEYDHIDFTDLICVVVHPGGKWVYVLSSPIRISPGAVVPTTAALAGGIDLEALTSKPSISRVVEVSDVPSSPISHTHTRVLRGAAIPTSPGGVINAGFNDTPSMGGQSEVNVGNTLLGFLIFVLCVLPLWMLPRWALRKMCGTSELGWVRSWRRRTRLYFSLPVRRVPRHRRPVFRTNWGYCWALNLLLGCEVGQHLLFVGAAPKGTLTDAEFKTASWGTFG